MRRVVVTGLGLVSPLGATLETLRRSEAEGRRVVPSSEGTTIAEIPVAHLPDALRARIGRVDRLTRLFLSATFSAVADAGDVGSGERLGLSFGTGLGCLLVDEEFHRGVVVKGPSGASPRLFAYTVSSAAAGEVSIALGVRGPNATIHSGLAAGLAAVARGAEWIARGNADVVLAGGADASGPALVDAIEAMGLRKRPGEPGPGVVPSEGATVLVLEAEDRATARDARILGAIEGAGLGFEPTLAGREPVSTAIEEVLREALGGDGAIDLVVTSEANGALDEVEVRALGAVLRDASIPRLAPRLVLGECWAASALLGVVLAVARGPGDRRRLLVSDVCPFGNVAALTMRLVGDGSRESD